MEKLWCRWEVTKHDPIDLQFDWVVCITKCHKCKGYAIHYRKKNFCHTNPEQSNGNTLLLNQQVCKTDWNLDLEPQVSLPDMH